MPESKRASRLQLQYNVGSSIIFRNYEPFSSIHLQQLGPENESIIYYIIFFQTQRQDSNDQFPESPNTESTQEAVPSQPSHESMETPTSSKTSRKRTIPREEKLEEAFEVIMRSAKIKMLNSTQDEFAVYGQYVGSELRQVKDEHSVLMAKHYINNIFIDARMGKYRRGYSTASSSIHSLDPTDSTDRNMSPEQLDVQISEIMSNIDSPNLSQ